MRYTDWEDDLCNDLYVIYEVPQQTKEGTIWQNNYTVLGIGVYGKLPRVYKETFHEADLALCSVEDLQHYPYGEQLATLQRVIRREIALSEKIWRDILRGRILFNIYPSWRDIHELLKKEDSKK